MILITLKLNTRTLNITMGLDLYEKSLWKKKGFLEEEEALKHELCPQQYDKSYAIGLNLTID